MERLLAAILVTACQSCGGAERGSPGAMTAPASHVRTCVPIYIVEVSPRYHSQYDCVEELVYDEAKRLGYWVHPELFEFHEIEPHPSVNLNLNVERDGSARTR
ncbi:hypothetical protein JYT28_01095, partial [Desulfobulbus sp. AH-315-M07]|nr:hypothetical protein [Desulfobulbus sp. AH-315-M07]